MKWCICRHTDSNCPVLFLQPWSTTPSLCTKEKPVTPEQQPLLLPRDWRQRSQRPDPSELSLSCTAWRELHWVDSPRGIPQGLSRGLACDMHCLKNYSNLLKQHENQKSIFGTPHDTELCARAPGIWISHKLGLCSKTVSNWNSGDKTDNELIQNTEMWFLSFSHQISGCSLACVLYPLPSLEFSNNSMNMNCILLQYS